MSSACSVVGEWRALVVAFTPRPGSSGGPKYLILTQTMGQAGRISYARPLLVDARAMALALAGSQDTPVQKPLPVSDPPGNPEVELQLVLAPT
jgi:hypothetical protein